MTDDNSQTVLSGDAMQNIDRVLAKAKRSGATHEKLTFDEANIAEWGLIANLDQVIQHLQDHGYQIRQLQEVDKTTRVIQPRTKETKTTHSKRYILDVVL